MLENQENKSFEGKFFNPWEQKHNINDTCEWLEDKTDHIHDEHYNIWEDVGSAILTCAGTAFAIATAGTVYGELVCATSCSLGGVCVCSHHH